MEKSKKLPNNMLTADQLLQNKGIKYCAWDEFKKSNKVLPKTGMKQFEPNDSWLQNMQIEKAIQTRKHLIGVERVDRISQLAIAEWLPKERRAKVLKYSGQGWNNFGLEKNNSLYLIPEEALFLLETNCMELVWNNVPLSIQQAYELLIDNVECSMEEYRVYSQLVRYGYRIQRFVYEHSERNLKSDETANVKRKVIVDPKSGLRMTDNQPEPQNPENLSDEHVKGLRGKRNPAIGDSDIEICQETSTPEHLDIEKDVHRVIEQLLGIVENIEFKDQKDEGQNNAQTSDNLDSNSVTTVNGDKGKRSSKVEIISEETLLGDFKIVREPGQNSAENNSRVMTWRGSRIMRNIKLLPKRTDKPISSNLSVVDSSGKILEQSLEKRKAPETTARETQTKKSRHEVIELSDDEIQEVPQPMTRMELLNLIPNIAYQSTITVNISRGYIPLSIRPQKKVYQYESSVLRSLQDMDRKLRGGNNSESCSNIENQNRPNCNNASRNEVVRRNPNVPIFNQNLSTNIHDVFIREYYPVERGQCANYSPSYMYNNRLPHSFNQSAFWQNRQNTMFHNVFVALENHGNTIHHNRFLTIQTNNFAEPHLGNNMSRYPFIRNHFRHNYHQNLTLPRKMYHHRVVENMSYHCSIARNLSVPESRQRCATRDHYRDSSGPPAQSNNEVYQSSFKILPGASTWTELKTKWREEKTITIDDEDSTKRDEAGDCNEIQVVEQLNNPLVGPKNISSLTEIMSKLRIIKSAPEKTVRRKKSKYKISYNVYSGAQHFRKATPGRPLYRIIVIRQKDDPFLQPIELQRLHQDANNSQIVLACVSMSISYIQPGFLSVPNLF